jgi:hypothetical protein
MINPAEFNEYIERKTAPVIKEFGIKLASPTRTRTDG